ncbi:peptidase domain-containing ABC transporter [Bailinhaonella thermotolerans]|uniref:Peptidase domain-containing ABC transporter n=1 Tax=Bailinhaonella thermotolerans TaxID=1070861 RepID=A0A3A4A6K4_9ACTN|nr:peptidase domain-containing ABC transporter [Bailinhaonella thermotolerans]RJL20382.1 peptidase domain-containing ABC transporter [Bailinhaonella thermotolerans]
MRRRVPLVRQHTMADCGAACLSMILGFHGRPTAVREVSEHVGVSRDGLTAAAIAAAGRAYGFRVRAFSVEPEALAGVTGPAVVHWEFNHFIVVERWTPKRVDVVDPAKGRRGMTAREFAAGFTGVVLVFEPGEDFPAIPRDPGRREWRRDLVRAILFRRKGLLVQVLLATLLLQGLGLLVPVLSGLVFSRVLPGADGAALLQVLGVGLAFAVLTSVVLSYLRGTLLLAMRARVGAELTAGVVDHLFALPYRFFTQRGASDLVMRTRSVEALRETLSGQLMSALLDGPLAIGYVALVVFWDPVFGAFLLAVAGVEVALLLGTRRRVVDLAERQMIAESAAQGRLIESINGIETLKASSAERRAVTRWFGLFTAEVNAETRLGLLTTLLDAVLGGMRFLAPAMLLLAGAWRVLGGQMTVGEMVALNGLAVGALTPLAALVASLQRLQQSRVHFERLADIVETEPETPRPVGPFGRRRENAEAGRGITVRRLAGEIELRRVSFRYDPRAPWILRDITLSVPRGRKLALVGRSGSGKSTLARIMLGLYPPTEGEIRYDQVSAAWLDTKSLRRQFGVVTQEPALFTGTIRENIALGRPDADLESIVEAARLACVHEDIVAMPMGYETVLTEGNGLSGGQRQRLALARAMLARPRVLLLDEATSHLDTATEAEIERNLADLTQTRIVIAHRLSTIRDADEILVIENGRIAERGTHHELLRLGAHYATLHAHQSPPT